MGYYFIVALFVFFSQTKGKNLFETKIVSKFVIFIMFCVMLAVALLNPIRADMFRYLRALNLVSTLKFKDVFLEIRWEPGFNIYLWGTSFFSTSKEFFITLTVIILWILIYLMLKKIFRIKDIPLVIFGYMSFFYFYSFFTNILRQGFAVVFVMLIIIYLEKNDYKKAVLFLIAGLSFHISSVVSIILFLVKKIKISIEKLLFIYATVAILMVTEINKILASYLIPFVEGDIKKSVVLYTDSTIIDGYGSVNRIDFLIFTTIFALWGLFFLKYMMKESKFYKWLIKSYLSLSIIYLLFGFIAYSDRLAAYAWFLIPIIIFYPVINTKSKYRLLFILLCIVINVLLFFVFEVNSFYAPLKFIY